MEHLDFFDLIFNKEIKSPKHMSTTELLQKQKELAEHYGAKKAVKEIERRIGFWKNMCEKNNRKVDMKFKQMTDDEIKQLKVLQLAARIMEISESGNIIKNGKLHYLSSYEAREIVEQLDDKRLEKLNNINFTIEKININGNKVKFIINDWIYRQNFGISFKEWEEIRWKNTDQ